MLIFHEADWSTFDSQPCHGQN